MIDVVIEPEARVHPELKFISPPIESYGMTDKGGRPRNEDAFFTSSQGFVPAEFDVGEYEGLIATDGLPRAQAKYLVDLLNGMPLESGEEKAPSEFQISVEDVLDLQQNLQDLVAQGKLGGLEIVADGAGGHGSGEIASTVGTLAAVSHIIRKGKGDTPITNETLHEAVTAANSVVSAVNRKIYGGDNMATTLVAALITPDGKKAYIDSVGDSRAYLVDAKKGEIIQITDDHSLVYVLLTNGQLELPSKIFTNYYKNVINRAIGMGGDFEIQSHEVKLDNDKVLVLCSDGVWEDLDLKVGAVSTKLEEVDQEFEKNTAGGIDRGEAAKIAFGRIFREINLRNLNQSLDTPQVLVDTLTFGAGQHSHDNVTAVAIAPTTNQ